MSPGPWRTTLSRLACVDVVASAEADSILDAFAVVAGVVSEEKVSLWRGETRVLVCIILWREV